jgi:predicted small secreted protein
MNTKLLLRVSMALLAAGSFSLTSCHTARAVGHDVEVGGKKVAHATGKGISYVGHGIHHAGDEIAEHTR